MKEYINDVKQMWRESEFPLQIMMLVIFILSILLIFLLLVASRGIIIPVVLAFWGLKKLVDRWAKE